ncbi:MAG: response regulator [Candidatus Aureabacteria bacterium]|nr:response regulator [Candidatus Auribacterota bacterium]
MKASYTIEQVAGFCQTSIWTIHRRIKEGGLRSFRAGGGRTVRIAKKDLINFIKENGIPMPEEMRLQKKRILIVDDDEKIVRSLVRYLKNKSDYEIETASSGFRAGVLINAFMPQVIVLDIMLGDINGRDVIKTLRSDEKHEDVKVIAISGYIKSEEIDELLNAGFNDYLSKPFKLSELMDRIEGFFEEVVK